MDKLKYIDLINELNELLPDTGFDDIVYNQFAFLTNGNIDVIVYGDITLWSSEEGEKENFKEFIINTLKRYDEYLPFEYKKSYSKKDMEKAFEAGYCSHVEGPNFNEFMEQLNKEKNEKKI